MSNAPSIADALFFVQADGGFHRQVHAVTGIWWKTTKTPEKIWWKTTKWFKKFGGEII